MVNNQKCQTNSMGICFNQLHVDLVSFETSVLNTFDTKIIFIYKPFFIYKILRLNFHKKNCFIKPTMFCYVCTQHFLYDNTFFSTQHLHEVVGVTKLHYYSTSQCFIATMKNKQFDQLISVLNQSWPFNCSTISQYCPSKYL